MSLNLNTLFDNGTHKIETSGFASASTPTKITKLAMSNRFTFAENVAIETAAETDASVRVVVKKLDLATYIDLSLPETEQLLSVLVTAGLINDARKSEILTTPVADSERYQ